MKIHNVYYGVYDYNGLNKYQVELSQEENEQIVKFVYIDIDGSICSVKLPLEIYKKFHRFLSNEMYKI